MIFGAKELTKQPLLVRADSGNDAQETLVVLEDAEQTRYIVKWNPRGSDILAWRDRVFAEGVVKTPRPGKRVGTMVVEERKKVNETMYTFKRIVRVIERTVDRKGQFLLSPELPSMAQRPISAAARSAVRCMRWLGVIVLPSPIATHPQRHHERHY